jgi:hypothetical protein
MTRRSRMIGFVALAALLAGPVGAEERKLTADEVTASLAGNTAESLPPGPESLQYFDPSGRTTYQMRNGEPSQGQWRVDADGSYCSSWRGGGWTCYDVLADGDTVVWVDRDSGARYPARMRAGRITTF